MELTLKRLALVPIMKDAWSNPRTQPVELGGCPLLRFVPMKVMFVIACKPGSYEPNSKGVI